MRLFGWVPPRYSLVKDGSVLVQYQDDPDERLCMHIRDVVYDTLQQRLNSMDEAIAELRGMLARHKVVDQRKPEKQECVRQGPSGPVPFTKTIKDRRGRKT